MEKSGETSHSSYILPMTFLDLNEKEQLPSLQASSHGCHLLTVTLPAPAMLYMNIN